MFNVMSWDFGGHVYILRSYQGNRAQELIRYVRPPRWHRVMATKHYSGMASHWPVIWYQVYAPRTGQQKTSRLSQDLQSNMDLASFTCLPVHQCGPGPTIFCLQPFPALVLVQFLILQLYSEVSFPSLTLAALVAAPSRHWSGLFSYHCSFSAHLRNLLNLLYLSCTFIL